MLHHAYPGVNFFTANWERYSYVREWICRPIFSFLKSITFGIENSHSVSNFISKAVPNCSVSLDMDVIEIDSSDCEDDVEFEWDSPDRSSNVGRDQNHGLETNFENCHSKNEKAPRPESSMSNRPWNKVSNANGANNIRSNGRVETSRISQERANNFPHVNGDGEVTYWTSNGLDATYTSLGTDSTIPSQHTHRRTLPSSFQSFISKPSYEHISRPHIRPALGQQQEPRQFKFSNGSDVDIHRMDNYRSKIDNELPQHTQKRILPPSLQQTIRKTASEGHIDYKGRKNVANKHETFDKRRVPPSSSINDDVLIYKTSGTHRVLPPTLMNGKSVDSHQLIGSSDAGNRSGLGEHKLVEHDERAIYQEALQNLGQPKLEDDLPEGLLSVSLLKHQKIALAWMIQKEKSVHCAGGILADDQGLGKTVSMIALMQKQRSQQSKFTSNDSQQIKPEALSLDDDDDNGVTELVKEIQIGNIDLEKKPVPTPSTLMHTSGNLRPAAGTLVVCPASVLRQWARELDEKVTSSAKLSVLVYHGGARTKDPSELVKYDVVLTTYAIVTNEVPKQSNAAADDDGEQRNLGNYEISSEFSSKKRKDTTNGRSKGKKKAKKLKDSQFDYDCGPLARVRWFRVILDEAQTIKNYRTQVARACSGLRAKRRWCLSGTPIQNSIDDLYSYFRFLKYDPYAVYSSFCNSIKFPISKNASHGYKKLQAVLRTVLLRRTKDTLINGEPIINLPPKSIFLKKVDFSPEERSFYLSLEADSRLQFKKYAAAGTVQQNYASILLLLLRLRQACDHPVLVKGRQSNTVGNDSLDMARKLPKDMQFNLLYQLEGSLAICAVCNDPPEDAVVTTCGHVFCYQCVSERLTGDDNLCPSPGCKDTLGRESVFSRSTLQSCISDQPDNIASSSELTHYDEASIVQSNYVSSKIKAAVEILNSLSSPNYSADSNECNGRDGPNHETPVKAIVFSQAGSNECNGRDGPNQETPVKAIVFSQWTGMLDLLEYSLNQSLIQYRRLDGSMSLASRDKSVKEFNTDPEVTVMLMSLKAGNLGLNMVAACHVILLDLWWNPTTEDQAVDRAHRIGQTRPVTVSRLTIKDTVEDRILALQEEKRKLVASAFGEDQSGGHATKLTVEDLRYLFMV